MVGRLGPVFVAVRPDDDFRHALTAHLNDVLDELPGKAVRPSDWHVTLRYLGRVPQATYERYLAALSELKLGSPFRIAFGGLGAFSRPRRAAVLWLDLVAGRERLAELALAADQAAVRIGLPSEERPFVPHLTLAQQRPVRDLSDLIGDFPPFPSGFRVGEIHMMHSGDGGYEVLESFSLS